MNSIPQQSMSTPHIFFNLQQSNGTFVNMRRSDEPFTKHKNGTLQKFYVTSHVKGNSQSPTTTSDGNVDNQSCLEDGMKIISEKQIIPFISTSNGSSFSSFGNSLTKTSTSVPISPITITSSAPIRTRTRTRPASTSGFSPRVESKQMSEQADKEKVEALQAIRELQAKGATTEDLSCHICQPSKCFTAYTTLLSHLRSHAGIRKFNCIHKKTFFFKIF